MRVEVDDLSFSYGAAEVLKHVSFSAGDGEIIAVLGPNGVGKSTLFGCMLGFLHPSSGKILLDGKDIADMSSAALAKAAAYIPQSTESAFHFTVLEMVTMGLSSQLRLLETPSSIHRDKSMAALEELGIGQLANRSCNRISGGERQLMLLARALVQDAGLLMMDEPTANLDYGNSFQVMRRIQALSRQGYTVIFSTHEPNQAFRYASSVLALKDGGVLARGDPDEALTEEVLEALYGVPVAVREVSVDGERYRVSVPYQ